MFSRPEILTPIDLGASVTTNGLFTVRDSNSVASAITFFGRAWLPVGKGLVSFIRIRHFVDTSSQGNVDIHGARFGV
jgi:hypothetical protein